MKYDSIKSILGVNCSLEQKAYQLFLLSLKPEMRKVFISIPKGIDNAVSAKQLKEITGIQTKNISTHVKNLSIRFPVKTTGTDRRKKYFL